MEDLACAIADLRRALTDPEEVSGSDGVLDWISSRLDDAMNGSNNNISWIAISLERIADALDRIAPAQEGGE